MAHAVQFENLHVHTKMLRKLALPRHIYCSAGVAEAIELQGNTS